MELTIEEVQALYFNDETLIDMPRLGRVNAGTMRYYIDAETGLMYDGWTSVISHTLPTPLPILKWYAALGYERAQQELTKKAQYGTLMHALIEKLLVDREIPVEAEKLRGIMDEVSWQVNNRPSYEEWLAAMQNDLLAFEAFAKEKELTVKGIEVPLCSKKYMCAGTIDIIGEVTFNKKRVRCIIDVKSGRKGFYESHQIQLHAYKEMYNEHLDERYPITHVFNWAPKEWQRVPAYHYVNQTEAALAQAVGPMVALHRVLNRHQHKMVKHIYGKVSLDETTPNYILHDLNTRAAGKKKGEGIENKNSKESTGTTGKKDQPAFTW